MLCVTSGAFGAFPSIWLATIPLIVLNVSSHFLLNALSLDCFFLFLGGVENVEGIGDGRILGVLVVSDSDVVVLGD